MAKKPNRVARAIIDATVDRGLREIAEDPKRSIRKLTDLGKQFSKTRFLEEIYSMMQDLLRNDDSPYYTAIENLLRNTSRQGLKDFGINIGYNSLTFGGKMIREEEAARSYYTPWSIVIRIAPDQPHTLSVAEIENCIEQGRPLGIYTYILRYSGTLAGLPPLLSLIRKCADCSFFLILPNRTLEPAHLEQLAVCTNIISLLPAHADSSWENVEQLRAKKCFYGIYQSYSDSTYKEVISPENLDRIEQYRSGFLFFLPEDSCSIETRKKVAEFSKECRIHPSYPFITFDTEAGVCEVDRIVSGNQSYFEMLENGDLRTSTGIISDFRHTIALDQLLQIALPKEDL